MKKTQHFVIITGSLQITDTSAGPNNIDTSQRLMYDSVSQWSLDWGNRTLHNEAGSTVTQWNTQNQSFNIYNVYPILTFTTEQLFNSWMQETGFVGASNANFAGNTHYVATNIDPTVAVGKLVYLETSDRDWETVVQL